MIKKKAARKEKRTSRVTLWTNKNKKSVFSENSREERLPCSLQHIPCKKVPPLPKSSLEENFSTWIPPTLTPPQQITIRHAINTEATPSGNTKTTMLLQHTCCHIPHRTKWIQPFLRFFLLRPHEIDALIRTPRTLAHHSPFPVFHSFTPSRTPIAYTSWAYYNSKLRTTHTIPFTQNHTTPPCSNGFESLISSFSIEFCTLNFMHVKKWIQTSPYWATPSDRHGRLCSFSSQSCWSSPTKSRRCRGCRGGPARFGYDPEPVRLTRGAAPETRRGGRSWCR